MPPSQTAVQESTPAVRENEAPEKKVGEPLLYQKRERVADNAYSGKTTSCKKTSNPADYGPDD